MSSTIREIARLTGFSIATVSRALGGKSRTSEETRSKIEKAARELHYQPLPLLSKALSLARQPEATRFRETLALIVEHSLKDREHFEREIHAGAEERAQSMGFLLEQFYLSGRPADHRALSKTLHARGVRGLIIVPRIKHRMSRLFLNWTNFAAVEIGRTIWMPQSLHRVERPIYFELIEVYHLLKKAGFRRIALAIAPYEDTQRRGIYTASYLIAQRKLPARYRLEPLTSGDWTIQVFQRWFKQNRPDVIIISNSDPVNLNAVPNWISKMGLNVPSDISLFSTNVRSTNLSGFRSDQRGMGAACVEMLSLLLNRDELGLSSQPRGWLVQDRWVAGESLKYPISSRPLMREE